MFSDIVRFPLASGNDPLCRCGYPLDMTGKNYAANVKISLDTSDNAKYAMYDISFEK